MAFKKALIIYKPGYKPLAAKVKRYVNSSGLDAKVMNRKSMPKQIKKSNLIIVVGGDGTFIRASHHLDSKIPIFGINPDPKKTEGFFTRATVDDYQEKLDKIIGGKYDTLMLNRLKVTINGKPLPELALNDAAFLNKKSHEMCRYLFQDEFQKSSGVIFSTSAGSHAWMFSAGGERLNIHSMEIQYIVREPYHGRLSQAKNLHGILPEHSQLKIMPKTDSCMMILDGREPGYHLKKGDKVIITSSKEKLCFIE